MREPAVPPPMRNGICASRVAVGSGPHTTVLAFLQARFPAAPDWAARMAQGLVLDAQARPLSADSACTPGMRLWYWRQPPAEPRVPFEMAVLHQCEHLVVVDKPHFLATTPGGRHLQETALVRLQQQLNLPTLAPMHRIDRDTAGVLVFTVRPETRHAYQALLRQRQVHKVYEAIAPWRAGMAWPLRHASRLEQAPGAGFMQMHTVSGEPNAETTIELLDVLPHGATDGDSTAPAQPLAHYRLTPHTGRKHQLRAQMSALGLPIVGDSLYPHLLPQPAPGAPPDFSQPLQLLARELAFTDPITGQARHFCSRLRLRLARRSALAIPA